MATTLRIATKATTTWILVPPRASSPGLTVQRDPCVGQHRRELARLEHLARDVAAAHEFTLDIELRYGRPVGVFLDSLTNIRVFEHIDPDNRRPEILQDLDDLARKSALRKLRCPLHEQANRVFRNHCLDSFASIRHGAGPSRSGESRSRP